MTCHAIIGSGQGGTAPVNTPINGFKIDGFLQRQTANAGDWLAGPGGSEFGTFILNNAGLPVAPLPGFVYALDLWDNAQDNVFAGNSKFSDDPNTMRWTFKRANPRNDINHGIIFFTQSPVNNHIWAIVSGDRYGTSGTDILDFEFLQNPVIKTALGNNNQGGFISLGPHDGRTIGDLVVSIQFSGDGSLGSTFVSQWQPGATEGEYGYFSLTPDAGTILAAFNSDPIAVPYGAFGSTTYPTLTFGEAAIDMTALIGGTGGSCNDTTPFRSLWIKSRSSSSANAQLQDFIEPIQIPYTINYDVSVSVGPYLPSLQSVQLTASVSPGTVADYSFFWIPKPGNPPGGSLNNPNIYNPVLTVTPPACGNFVYEVIVTSSFGCIVARKTIVIQIPCGIGKPINPDQANLQQSIIPENSNTKNEIIVYPNPSTGNAKIILPNDNNPREIELLDIKGAVLQKWNLVSTNIVQFKNVPAGLYILKIVNASGSITTKKIIIEK